MSLAAAVTLPGNIAASPNVFGTLIKAMSNWPQRHDAGSHGVALFVNDQTHTVAHRMACGQHMTDVVNKKQSRSFHA